MMLHLITLHRKSNQQKRVRNIDIYFVCVIQILESVKVHIMSKIFVYKFISNHF